MEIRKVQVTGGSSYIVSLPKDWVKASGIQKNDPVGLIVQPDGTLLVTPKITPEVVQREKRFEVSATTDQTFIFRCLIGAYIAGYTTITLFAQARLPPQIRIQVRQFTQMAIGQEVVDETETSITIKDLLSPAEMPFQNTIKRMGVLVRGMHRDGVEALISGNRRLAEDVLTRDNDVDRLHWLVARQTHLVLTDPNLSRKMEVNPSMATSFFLISRIIERIGDHATRVAKNALLLLDDGVSGGVTEMIREASATSQTLFDQALKSLFSQDLEGANETLKHVSHLEKQARALNEEAMRFDAATATAIVSLSDSIKRTGEYSGDICETVINHLINEGA